MRVWDVSLQDKAALVGWGVFTLGLLGVFMPAAMPLWAVATMLGPLGFGLGALAGRRWSFLAVVPAALLGFAPAWCVFGEAMERFLGLGPATALLVGMGLYLLEACAFLALAFGLRAMARAGRAGAVVVGAGVGILLVEALFPKINAWNWAMPLYSLPLVPRAAAFVGARGLSVLVWMGGAWGALRLAGGLAALREARQASSAGRTVTREALAVASGGPVAALVVLVVLGLGWGALPREAEHSLDLLVVQPMMLPEGRGDLNEVVEWAQTDQALRKLELPGAHPCLVVWPESALYGPGYLEVDASLAEQARRRGVAWVFGAMVFTGPPEAPTGFHSLVHFYPPVGTSQRYARASLYPWVEEVPGPGWFRSWVKRRFGLGSYTAGRLTTFNWSLPDGSLLRLVPLLCGEAVLPGRVQQGVAVAGGDLLLNLTNDAWFGDSSGSAIHGYHAAFRAVEMGLPLVRGTNSGLSGIFREDGTGELWGEPMRREEFGYTLVWRPIRTPMRSQAWSWLLVVLLGSAFGWTLRRRR